MKILIIKGRSIFLMLFLFFFSFLSSAYVFAQPPRTILIFCLDMIMRSNEKIPIGCEIIDCCKGCPKNKIDIQFDFKAQEGISLILNFELPYKGLREKIKINGNAKWLNEKQIQILPGEISISGIPFSNIGYINPEYRVTKKFKAEREDFARLHPYHQIGALDVYAELLVKKFIDEKLVLEQLYYSIFRPCKSTRPPTLGFDMIRVNNNSDNDNLLILSDGNRSLIPQCSDDEEFRTQNLVGVGNYFSSLVCNAETLVFSLENAMNIKTSVDVWQNPTGDIDRVSLDPLLEVPVIVWLLATVPRTGQLDVRTQAQGDIEQANILFNTNRVGIHITAEYRDKSTDPLARGLLEPFKCDTAAAIIASNYFEPGKINIYYTNTVLDRGNPGKGVCCWADAAGNPFHPELIGISPISVLETFTHELGHSFSLKHIDLVFCTSINCSQVNCSGGRLNLGTENIMYGGASNRSKFTIGQAFRINIESNSTLNTLAYRTGPTRTCGFDCSNTCIRFENYVIW